MFPYFDITWLIDQYLEMQEDPDEEEPSVDGEEIEGDSGEDDIPY